MSTGTVNVSRVNNRIDISWTSNSSGAVNCGIGHVRGIIEKVVQDPDDTDTPTTGYDITLTDTSGLDVLASQGINIDSSAASVLSVPAVATTDGSTSSIAPMYVDDVLTLVIADAGSEKSGVVRLYVS